MFESIYITDANQALAYEYLVFLHSPTFSEVGGILCAKFKVLSGSPDSILHIPLNQEYSVCCYKSSTVLIYLLCHKNEKSDARNPLFPNVFLEKLVVAAEEYFGSPLAPTKVSANSDTLTLLINEMVVNGAPHITEVNNLKDIVLLKSLLNTILRAGNQLASAATNKTLASLSTGPTRSLANEDNDIPWRKSNVKYTNNEMFVDVVESVNAIMRPSRNKKKLKLLSSSNFDSAFYSTSSSSTTTKLTTISRYITGQIDIVSHISGVPQLQVLLNSAASAMEAVLLHRCINIDTWNLNKTLSFIPPDGKSTLLNYTIDADKLYGKSKNGVGLLDFDCDTALGLEQNEFEFRILSLNDTAVSKIELIKVEVYAYEPVSNDNEEDETISGRDNGDFNAVTDIKTSRVTDGDFLYKGNGSGEWVMKNIQPGSQNVLRASIRLNDSSFEDSSNASSKEDLIDIDEQKKKTRLPIAPVYFQVSYLYKGLVPSGLQVESLKLVSAKGLGDSVKPYKGVKYITKTGSFTVRTQ